MPAAIDAQLYHEGGNSSTVTTGTFTVGSGATLIVVGIIDRGNGAINSVTGAGVSLTSLGTPVSISDRRVHLYAALNPQTGSGKTVQVSGTGSYGDNQQIGIGVITFTGATGTSNYSTATGTGTAVSVTVSSVTSDDYVFDMVFARNPGSPGAGQTRTGGSEPDGTFGPGSSHQPGSEGGVMSWTLIESLAWATAAVRIVGTTSGGGGNRRRRFFMSVS